MAHDATGSQTSREVFAFLPFNFIATTLYHLPHRDLDLAVFESIYAGVKGDRIVAGATVYVVHLPIIRADRVVARAAGDRFNLSWEAVVGVYQVIARAAGRRSSHRSLYFGRGATT